MFHLKLPTAKRLYGFLDKRFYHSKRLSFDLRTLACEHVGMSRDYKSSELKRKLSPAIAELVSIGFLQEVDDSQRYSKVGHGVYQVHFHRKSRETIGTLPLSGNKGERSENRQLVKALTDHGLTASTARQFVEDPNIDNDHIRLQIEVLEWKIEDAHEDPPAKPGGYLRRAIVENYDPPKNFKPKADREAETKRILEASKRRQEENRRRTQAEQQQAAAAEHKKSEEWSRIENYLAGLSEEEREICIDDAFANASGHFMMKYARKYRAKPTGGGIGEGAYREFVSTHVQSLLAETLA